jgi:hypothetical protein
MARHLLKTFRSFVTIILITGSEPRVEGRITRLDKAAQPQTDCE